SLFRLSVMLRLLRARNGIPIPKGSLGLAMTSTSMPRSASIVEQNGPGSWRERSSMRRFASGVVAGLGFGLAVMALRETTDRRRAPRLGTRMAARQTVDR